MERVASTIMSKVSFVRFFGEGPAQRFPLDPAIFTQKFAPIRSASANCVRHFASACLRSLSLGLIGLLHAPTSAMMMLAFFAALA